MKRLAFLPARIAMGSPAAAGYEVLLRDDFDGASLDPSKWFVPTGPGTFFVAHRVHATRRAGLTPTGPLRSNHLSNLISRGGRKSRSRSSATRMIGVRSFATF